MSSVISQERVLGAASGSVMTGVIIFEGRKRIYGSISDDHSHGATKSQMKEPMFSKAQA